MTISYNWLCDYLPVQLEPERLSTILTSIGLEVESVEAYESVKGGLAGLVIGEVLEAVPHPNADKLKLTTVSLGGPETFSIVCGAANVAAGQTLEDFRRRIGLHRVIDRRIGHRMATVVVILLDDVEI